MRKLEGRRWTDQEIFDAFYKWAEEHGGRPPSFRDWQHASADHPTAMTVRQRFGRWSAALEMLGFTPNPPGGAWRRDRDKENKEKNAAKKRARAMRKRGVPDSEILATLGISANTLRRWAGKKVRTRKPRTAAEKREAAVAALKQALTREAQ